MASFGRRGHRRLTERRTDAWWSPLIYSVEEIFTYISEFLLCVFRIQSVILFFIFHANIDSRMKVIPSCKVNFKRYACVYGGVPREEWGAGSCAINCTMIGMYKGNVSGFVCFWKSWFFLLFFFGQTVFWIWTYVRFLDEHHVCFCTWGPRCPFFNEKVVKRWGRRCTHLRYHPHIEIWNISASKSTRNSRWLRGYPVNGLNTVKNNEIAAEHAKNSVQYTLQISNSNQFASYLSLDNSHHELQLRTPAHISWQVIIWISACRWWETQESLWSDSNASR